MITTPANLQFFFTNLETNYFWKAYYDAPLWWEKLATRVPTSSEFHLFGWMGRLDTMREWTGARVVHTPGTQTYLVPVQKFELTESIDQFKLLDDTYGIYFPIVTNMGKAIAKKPDYSLRDLIKSTGEQNTTARQLGSDGVSGWSLVHPVDFYDASKGTYISDFTSGGQTVNGVTVGGALSPVGYQTLWSEIASRKSETGESMGVIPDTTVVPPQLDFTGKTLLQATFLAPKSGYGNTDNVGAVDNVAMRSTTELLMVPEFSAEPTIWYLLATKGSFKPFIWLDRQAPDFTYRINPQDPAVFDTHTYLYGSVMRGAPAWGPAFLRARSGP